MMAFTDAAKRIDSCLLAAQRHKRMDCLRQDLIKELLVAHRKGFDSGLMMRVRATPKRYYTGQEIAVFRADGTNWPEMFRTRLHYFERGNFDDMSLADARRMGELAGLSNKQIGSAIATARARAKREKP
ncbi:MAG TPA: hypothetical protein VF543_22565 [Pyrinomonadaceae bacterium]|jgi:hypothetical protein